MEILGLQKPDFLIRFAPLGFQFLFLIPLYLTFKNLSSTNYQGYCWVGLLLFYIGNWIGQSYLAPQSFGYLIWLTIIFLLTKIIDGKFASSIPLILFLAFLTINHILTAMLSLIMLALLNTLKKTKMVSLIIIGSILLLSWLSYGTTTLYVNIPQFIMESLRLDTLFKKSIIERFEVSASHQAVNLIRILTFGVYFIIAFIGFLFNYRKKSKDDVALIIEWAIIVLTVILGGSYGFELLYRTYFFSLPIMAHFGARLISKKTMAILLCSLVVVLLPLHFVSHFGNQAVDYISPSHLHGIYFFSEHTNSGIIINSGADPLGFLKNAEHYYFTTYDQLFIGEKPSFKSTIEKPIYVSISRLDEAIYDFHYNNPQYIQQLRHYLEKTGQSIKIYDSPGLKLYIELISKFRIFV
jgi:hypothetical protein